MKKYRSGIVVDPMTIGPDATLADALGLMKAHKFSGVPVVEHGHRPDCWAFSPTVTSASPAIRGSGSAS